MDNRFLTLLSLTAIVKDVANPTAYPCTVQEMILHSTFDWDNTLSNLLKLQLEGYTLLRQADVLQISITQKGLAKAEALLAKESEREV